ncbi:MAG: prepilin-type N-terminal cleavage/methylation domain-containing protein, partial [Oscillospiraceae bacterium]|nr:prepilin-type N-terminal cleavage/methylation domain-containing protein [Oscillospiraceae bacterium]
MQSKHGFTLAELLIVVAIIAILVAIGIPAFSTAMERSRETVDLSNIRGAYAEFMAGTLGSNANTGYYKINVKQRNCTDWVVDCKGFLTNIVKADTTNNKY